MKTVLLRSFKIAGMNLRGGLASRDQLRSPAHVLYREPNYAGENELNTGYKRLVGVFGVGVERA